MKTLGCRLFYLAFSTAVLGQTPGVSPVESPSTSNNRLLQTNMDMPLGVGGEQYLHGLVDMPLTTKTAIRMERFYTRFGNQEHLIAGAALKYFWNRNLYSLLGAGARFDLSRQADGSQGPMTRLNFGMGYHLKPKVFMEMGYKPSLSAPSNFNNGFSTRRNTLYINARF